MQFNSINEVFYMAGHGQYVWLAYAITVTLGLALVMMPMIKKRRLTKVIQQMAQLESE